MDDERKWILDGQSDSVDTASTNELRKSKTPCMRKCVSLGSTRRTASQCRRELRG